MAIDALPIKTDGQKKIFYGRASPVDGKTRRRPFEITLGKTKILQRNPFIFEQVIAINGVEFKGAPSELVDFFAAIACEIPGISSGICPATDENMVNHLLDARVIEMTFEGAYFPTEAFRNISFDFIRYLASPVFCKG